MFCRAKCRPVSAKTRQCALDVHALQSSKRLQVNLDKRTGQRETCVHDDDVHAAPCRGYFCESVCNGFGIGHVHRHTDDALRVVLLEFRDKFFKPLARQIRDGNVTARSSSPLQMP